MVRRIVLDTNCLLASISRRGRYYDIWQQIQKGNICLCVSNDILQEYAEIISMKTNDLVADSVINVLLNCPGTIYVDPTFHFHLIERDDDDNMFVDCAIVSNASFIVSEDSHFKVLNKITFPQVNLIRLEEFKKLIVKDLITE